MATDRLSSPEFRCDCSHFSKSTKQTMAGHRRSKRKAEQSLGTRRSSRRSAARDDDDNLYGQDYGILPSD